MATTGFWPVKNRLKEVIDYARNPDKTTDKKFLDEDLYAALRYVENDKKTDQTMYVSGINCPKQRAYQYMMATKRRYGKLGGNVAYHGYQSFVVRRSHTRRSTPNRTGNGKAYVGQGLRDQSLPPI